MPFEQKQLTIAILTCFHGSKRMTNVERQTDEEIIYPTNN